MNAITTIIDETKLISMNDAAKMLGMSYYEVYNLSSSGRLGRVKKGTRIFIPQDDVREWLATRQQSPAPIAWRPIAAIPADRMDGRDMLLWVEGRYPVICTWLNGWCDGVGHPVFNVTDWADVEGPAQ